MILKVGAHARQIDDDRDSLSSKILCRADARELEDLRGLDGSRAKITSRPARAVCTPPPCRYSIPTARSRSMRILETCAPTIKRKFGRASVRYEFAVEDRRPLRWVR